MIEKVERAFRDRTRYESLWEDVYEVFAPDRGGFQTRVYYDELYKNVYDSTPIIAADRLANTLISGLIPPWTKWAKLEPSPLVDDAQADNLRELLDLVNEVLFIEINKSGLACAIQPAMLDVVIGGTGALKMRRREDRGFSVVNVPLRGLAIDEDADGKIVSVYERVVMNGMEFIEHPEWAGVLNDEERRQYGSREDVTVYSAIHRSPGPREKWEYADYVEGRKDPLTQKTMDRNPYIVFRYAKVNDEPYGRGPALMMYADARTLNKARELTLKAAAFDALGLWIARADSVLNPYAVSLRPGGVVPVNDTSNDGRSLRRIDNGSGSVLIGERMMNELRASIQNGFLTDQFAGAGDRMTAQEVVARIQLSSRALGSVYARMVDELLTPFVRSAISILKAQRVLPDIDSLDIDGEEVNVIYVSALASAQRSQEAATIFETAQISAALGQLDHAATYVVNYAEAARRIARARAIPESIIRTEAEARKMATEDAKVVADAQRQSAGVPDGAAA